LIRFMYIVNLNCAQRTGICARFNGANTVLALVALLGLYNEY